MSFTFVKYVKSSLWPASSYFEVILCYILCITHYRSYKYANLSGGLILCLTADVTVVAVTTLSCYCDLNFKAVFVLRNLVWKSFSIMGLFLLLPEFNNSVGKCSIK